MLDPPYIPREGEVWRFLEESQGPSSIWKIGKPVAPDRFWLHRVEPEREGSNLDDQIFKVEHINQNWSMVAGTDTTQQRVPRPGDIWIARNDTRWEVESVDIEDGTFYIHDVETGRKSTPYPYTFTAARWRYEGRKQFVCPECQEQRDLPDGDYLCEECRARALNGQ